LDGNPSVRTAKLNNCSQILDLSLPHQLIKAANDKLLEVRGGPVEFTRGPVLVLLIDYDRGWVVLDRVRDKADAPRLLTGGER
jgi:hypothetical protein